MSSWKLLQEAYDKQAHKKFMCSKFLPINTKIFVYHIFIAWKIMCFEKGFKVI